MLGEPAVAVLGEQVLIVSAVLRGVVNGDAGDLGKGGAPEPQLHCTAAHGLRAIDADDLYAHRSTGYTAAATTVRRLESDRRMDDRQKQDISDSLPWLWPPAAELFPHRASIEHLNAVLPIKELRILEPGCSEGYTSVYLAKLGAQVTAFDVRPMSVVRAFARSLYHGVRLDLHVGDARQIGILYAPDSCDLVFHAGLLYHMRAPAEHLRQVAKLAPYVFLDTHIALEDRVTNVGLGEICDHEGLKGRWYAELGWRDELSGAEERSFWLTEDALSRLCESYELSITRLSRSDDTPNGPRIAWLLSRSGLQ